MGSLPWKKIDIAREIAHSVMRNEWRLWPPPECARDRLSEGCIGGSRRDGWTIVVSLASCEPMPANVHLDDKRCRPLRPLVRVHVSSDGESVLEDESSSASWDELLAY